MGKIIEDTQMPTLKKSLLPDLQRTLMKQNKNKSRPVTKHILMRGHQGKGEGTERMQSGTW